MSGHDIKVTLLVCLHDADTRADWAGKLPAIVPRICDGPAASTTSLNYEFYKTLDSAAERMAALLADKTAAAILISDILLEPNDTWRAEWRQTSAIKELRDQFANDPYVSLVIDDQTRIADVDLALPRKCSENKMREGLELLIQRLHYLIPPKPLEALQSLKKPRKLENQTELLESFNLRHLVYRIMGYLEDDAFDRQSTMEVNYCDLIANHYGAFAELPDGRRELVGMARLILTSGSDRRYQEFTYATCKTSDALMGLLRRDQEKIAMFRLPIFHTLPLDKEMKEAFTSTAPWAELSRVIVHPQWRGRGIARALVKVAVDDADSLEVRATLLECLDVHRKMYGQMGFEPMCYRGEVMGIGKTMLGMRRDCPVMPAEKVAI